MMINTQLEKLVSLVMDAFVEGVPGADQYRKNAFELQLRRKLMETYCNNTPSPAAEAKYFTFNGLKVKSLVPPTPTSTLPNYQMLHG